MPWQIWCLIAVSIIVAIIIFYSIWISTHRADLDTGAESELGHKIIS